jgi:hypothetical protein
MDILKVVEYIYKQHKLIWKMTLSPIINGIKIKFIV